MAENKNITLADDEKLTLELKNFQMVGVDDYNALLNRPKINGVEVSGEKALDDYDIKKKSEANAEHTEIKSAISTETAERKTADSTLTNLISAETTRAEAAEKANADDISDHSGNTSNPHKVTKAQVGLGNVDNTADVDKPVSNAVRSELNNVYKIGGQYNNFTNNVGNVGINDAGSALYKIRNLYAISGEGDYFYLAHKKSNYTITTTDHFIDTKELFTSDLSTACMLDTSKISDNNPAVITISSDQTITATDVLTLLFWGYTAKRTDEAFTHWKLEIRASRKSDSSVSGVSWKDGDWITVFERKEVIDYVNGLYCNLNPYLYNGVYAIWISGIRITIYSARPFSTNPNGFAYNKMLIAGLRLLDSRPSFSPAEALGALDIAGGTVYGKTTFQEGIAGNVYGNATSATKATQDASGNVITSTYATKADLANKLYPVGSIYMSINATSPETLFGGTWEQIKGRFLADTGSNDLAVYMWKRTA